MLASAFSWLAFICPSIRCIIFSMLSIFTEWWNNYVIRS
jgi:hypothetical protein